MSKTENRLLTPEVLAALAPYPLYAQETAKIPDLVAVAAFRIGAIRWYICEGNAEGETFTFYGLVCGMNETPELGYINANELASIAVDGSAYGLPGFVFQVFPVQDFTPCRLADIKDEDVQAYCAGMSVSARKPSL